MVLWILLALVALVGLVLILFHFAFPFIILLSRDLKRNAKWLAIMAVFILAMRCVDMFYQIAPSPTVGGGHGDKALVLDAVPEWQVQAHWQLREASGPFSSATRRRSSFRAGCRLG